MSFTRRTTTISSPITICSSAAALVCHFVLLLLFGCPVLAQNLKTLPNEKPCESRLIQAIQKRDSESALRLIRGGGNLNAKNCPEGKTALSESIANGLPLLALELVERGADVNLTDSKGVSPLMQASFSCQVGIVSALLKGRANINATDSDGTSAMMYAASNCADGNVVVLLLRSSAKIDLRNSDGDTALTIAVRNGDEFAVRELTAAGADLNAKNNEGETALALARDITTGRKPSHDRITLFCSTCHDWRGRPFPTRRKCFFSAVRLR